jgi:hypothetical protein
MWNGSQAQLSGFQSLTNVTFPLLLKASSGTSFGVSSSGSIDALMVIDKKGIVRQFSGSSTSSLNSAAAFVAQLLEGDRPRLSVTQGALDFGEIEIGRQISRTVTVGNDGEGTLQITGVTSDLPGVSATPAAATVLPGDTVDLVLSLTVASEGSFSGDLHISSNDPDFGVVTVFLQGSAIVVLADPRTDFNADGRVDFVDFLQFVVAYNSVSATHDLDDDGRVEFSDFLLFIKSYARPLP